MVENDISMIFLKDWDLWDCVAEFLEKMVDSGRISITNGSTEKYIIENILKLIIRKSEYREYNHKKGE